MPAIAKFVEDAGDDRLDRLARTLFRSSGVDGVYARTGLYEGVVEALAALISTHRPAAAEILRFPPVMSRRQLEKHGYLKSFPNLLGCVSCLSGTEREIRAVVERFEEGDDWTGALGAGDLVLSPAACYPVYPIAAARGPGPGRRPDLRRGQRLLPPRALARHRPLPVVPHARIRLHRHGRRDPRPSASDWIERAKAIADPAGPELSDRVASDPFFGRGGQIVAISQIEQELKFELLVPVRSTEEPTACMSFNYHREHFGHTWGLSTEDGFVAHTGCVAFGMDRLAVALFATHGTDIAAWPAGVRAALRV